MIPFFTVNQPLGWAHPIWNHGGSIFEHWGPQKSKKITRHTPNSNHFPYFHGTIKNGYMILFSILNQLCLLQDELIPHLEQWGANLRP